MKRIPELIGMFLALGVLVGALLFVRMEWSGGGAEHAFISGEELR